MNAVTNAPVATIDRVLTINNYKLSAFLIAAILLAPPALAVEISSPAGAIIVTIYRDGDDADWESNPYDYEILEQAVNRKNTLELKLAAGGGAAIRFRPKPGMGQ